MANVKRRSKSEQTKQSILEDLGQSDTESFTQEAQINEHVDTLMEYAQMKKLSQTAKRDVDKQHCRKQLLGLRKELGSQRKELGLLNSKRKEKEVADFFKPKRKPKHKLKVINAGNKRTA